MNASDPNSRHVSTSIEDWLHELGLGQYAETFLREDVSFQTLRELNESDLEALGVSLGHRKQLLRALAENSPDGVSLEQKRAKAPASWARQPGERKLVTLLFADIAGSTALTELLDAEEAHDRLYGAVQRMCESVERHGGTVCRFMGDGLMAMFGAPVAFEDHAVQACAAALALQDDIKDYADELEREFGCRIESRVGVNTGEVVVLRVGSAGKEEYDASGANVALAARMEQTATPGTVQVTSTTFGLVESRFEGEPLPPVTVKGFSEPVATFRLVRETACKGFADGARFVGRRLELDQLEVLLDGCLHEGSGRCVALRGEAGIGKSALAERFARLALDHGFQVHRSRALDFGWVRGHDAARLLLRDILGVQLAASEAERIRGAQQAISEGLVEAAMRAHLHDLLDLPAPPDLEAGYSALPAEERAEQRRDLLASIVMRVAQRDPRLMLIEDLHWAQPAVWAYFVAIARVIPGCPAIMLLTARPTADTASDRLESLLGDVPFVIHGIGPLSRRDAETFAATFGIDDRAVVEECIARSGRNPLFLEQLLRSRVEGQTDELPGSIQTLVASQLDRLTSLDKRAAQAAAVLGKSFDLEALRDIIEEPDYDCGRLVAQRLVRNEGSGFTFYHALVQEGVLSSLLRRDKRALHAAAARWFATRDAVLHARHLDLAEDSGAAQAYLEAARAEVSSYRFTFAEEHAGRGLALAPRDETAYALQSLQGEVFTALGRNLDAATAFRAAADLADDPKARCQALLGAAYALRIVDRYEEGLQLLDEALKLARDNDALSREQAQIFFVRGTFHFLRMDSIACERDARKAYELAKACGDPEMEALALTGLVRPSYLTARMISAAKYTRAYLEICDQHDLEYAKYSQIHMMVFTLHHEARFDEAVAYSRESREHAPRVGAPRQAVIGLTEGAETLVEAGRFPEAVEFARAAIDLSRRVGERRLGLCAQALLIRAEDLELHPELAERELRALWESLDEAERRFSGWWALGALMLAARGPATRRWAVAQALILSPESSYGVGRLRFLHDAILASIRAGELSEAADFADELEAFHKEGLTPLSTLYVRAARAAASGNPESLRAIREDAGLAALAPLVEAVDALELSTRLPE